MTTRKKTTWKMTEEEFKAHRDEYSGGCISCGTIQYGGVEPDAEDYECEACGESHMYGIENLLHMGRIDIID